MKIRRRFIMYFVGIAILCLVAIAADSFYNVDKLIVQNEENNLSTLADIQKSRIEEITDEHLQLLTQITGRTGIIDALASYTSNPNNEDKRLLETRVLDAKRSVEDFENVGIVDTNGQLITSADPSSDINQYHPLAELSSDVDKNIVRISENETGKKKIILHGPVKKNDQMLGTVVIVYDLADLEAIASDYSGLGNTGETTIAFRNKDGDAEYIKAPRFYQDQGKAVTVPKTNTKVAITQALLKNESLSKDLTDYRGKAVYSAMRYIPDQDWGLVVKKDKAEIYQPIFYHATQLGIITLAIIIFTIFLSLLAANKISKPIEKLKLGAEEIAGGNLRLDVTLSTKDEIGDLSRAFNKMMVAVIASRAEVDNKVSEQTKEITEKAQDMQDQQKAIINILEDVEEEKELTEREKDKVDTILKSIGDAVFVVDKDLKIVLVNQVTVDICGLKEEELVGKKYSEVLRFVFQAEEGEKEKVNDKFVNDAISTGKVQEMSNHTVLINKKGERIPVADSAAPLLNQKNEIIGCVVVFRDVTHEYEIDKAKTEFVSLASHQLRTPLSAINWYSEMLTNGDAGKLTDEQKQYVDEIYKGNQRMVDLVNSLLNVSRIELGTFMIDPAPTDLVAMAQEVVKEQTPLITKKKLKVVESYGKDVPKINVDPKLTRIIMQNLLSNAIKYTEKGQVEISLEKEKEDILIKVADTGLGIPKSQQDKMFQKLFRADNVRKTDTEGTGLGLYIIKSILDHTGGTIRFESVENKGTTFYATIPLKGMEKKEGTKTID